MEKKFVCFLALLAGLSLSCARSTTLLRGDEARRYLAAENRLLAPGDYTVLEITDHRVGNLAVAIFNRDRGGENAGNFQWLKREKIMGYQYLPETYNILLLNTPEGKRGGPPTEELIGRIAEAELIPVVIFNRDEEEEAVVYKRGVLALEPFLRPDSTLRLELGRRAGGSGNMDYTFEIK